MKNFLWSLWYRYNDWRYERKCVKYLSMKPQKIYVSQEAYDELVRRINKPPDPEVVEKLRKFMGKPSPWDDEN